MYRIIWIEFFLRLQVYVYHSGVKMKNTTVNQKSCSIFLVGEIAQDKLKSIRVKLKK